MDDATLDLAFSALDCRRGSSAAFWLRRFWFRQDSRPRDGGRRAGFDLVSAALRTRQLPPALHQDTVSLSLAPTTPSPSLFESPRPPLGLARDKTMTSPRFDKTEEVSSLVSIAPWGRRLCKRLPMGQDTGPSARAPPGVASAKTLLWMAAEPAGGGIAVLAMTSMRCAKTAPVSALSLIHI